MIHAHDVEAELWRFVDDGDQPSPNDLWRCIQYTARKKATALPSSFTRDSEMHLVDQHMIDTTDRHLVKAFCEQFRPGATERDMQKPLFYLTPFITCSKCNSILFIDAANARCFGAPVPESVRLKRGGNETLAVCPGCAMTENLEVGAHDFMEDIEDAREAMAKEMKKRKRAASLLIMVYRFYLRRQLARAARTRQKCRYYLYHRCASIVESAARGRLGRRRARTFENLRYIKNRHPISLKKALNQKFEIDKRTGESKRLKKVFWYHTKVQLDCLYRDYFILCQRTGFVPPRIIVEQNIEEIARRIRVREEYLITLIQALYRGIILRKCLEIYKYEIIRIREIRAQSCFRIGTIWRGYVARRLRVPARIAQVLRRKRPEQYARERREKRDRIRAKAARSRLRQLYEKERAEEATARASGLVNPNNVEGGGGKKMAAFLDSAYGSDDVRRGGRQLLDGIAEYDARIQREKEEKQARKDWLRKAVADEAERGPKFLRGKISKDNYNGTYDLEFEDGTKEAAVDVLKIKQAEGFPKPSLGHKWKVGMVCMGRYSHKRDLCGHDVNDAGAYKRYYHRDEMSANSQQLIDKLTTFQVKPSHDSRSLLKNHNQRMEKRGRGISFDFPSTLYGDPRAALYEGERSPISPKDSEARAGEFT